MKKVLFSLAFAVMLFSSCGSDENVPAASKTGELFTEVTFDGLTSKAATSTAIPVTTWSNVNKIQLFLYNATSGVVAFSDIIDPAASTTKIFKWTNVPQGTYELAIVANINSATDNVATSLDGGANWTKFDAYNVLGKALNSQLFIDLKNSVLPSGHTSKIAKIHLYDQEIEETFPPMSVTIELEDDIDISRGDMIVKTEFLPTTSQDLELMICWFDQSAPLSYGTKYTILHTTKEARCVVKSIDYKLNVNDLSKDLENKVINMNDIAKITIKTTKPLVSDHYSKNRMTGSVIIIDEGTNNTVAAGMII